MDYLVHFRLLLMLTFVTGLRNRNSIFLKSSLVFESSTLPLSCFVDIELLMFLQPDILLLQGFYFNFSIMKPHLLKSEMKMRLKRLFICQLAVYHWMEEIKNSNLGYYLINEWIFINPNPVNMLHQWHTQLLCLCQWLVLLHFSKRVTGFGLQ